MRWLLQRSSLTAAVIGIGSGNARSVVTSCRAVVLPRLGGPEVLELRDNVPVPRLCHDDVLVRTRAVSVNQLDCNLREGYDRYLFQPILPCILGRDISGEVVAVGSSVNSISVGQEVFGALDLASQRGTYADYSILKEDELISKPESISHVDASAIPFAALRAWHALRRIAKIKHGQRVLVFGGEGPLGFSAIQLAVALGCHVSTTCRAESVDRILTAGAEQAVDYTQGNESFLDMYCSFKDKIKGDFDAVLDMVGAPDTELFGTTSLKRFGRYITRWQDKFVDYPQWVLQTEASVKSEDMVWQSDASYWFPTTGRFFPPERFPEGIPKEREICRRAEVEGLKEIGRLTEAGKLNVPIEKIFPITQFREAHEAKRTSSGKIVLEFD